MSLDSQSIAGDQARLSVVVGVPPEVAFRIFTEEIDLWWRRGLKYRRGTGDGTIHMEPGVGGRLLESFQSGSETKIYETGKTTVWEPPSRLVFDWRAANFSTDENTEVEVTFQKRPSGGTIVTVTHRGWSRIRSDHPVRHHLETSSFIRMIGLWWGDLVSSMRDYSAGGRNIDRKLPEK